MSCPENTALQRAVEALGDDLAAELRQCEEILKFEADVAKRRVAGNRFIELTNRRAA
ncbi:hypothetical protein [Rhizobiales bacterium 3FA27D7]|jgi:hypothetical protein|uniref:hypothetical protein n=1 Tax=Mesorhizobium sp. 2RAF21 TaxID=3232995 RepID=UPI001484FC17